MARLIGPDEACRIVYLASGSNKGKASAQGLTAAIYADEALTTLADIQTEGGVTIADSTVTVDDYSRIPLFRFPDGVDTVYTTVNGGPATALYARVDDRIDTLATALTAATSTADGALQRTGGTMTGDLTLSGSGADLSVGGTATVTGRLTASERLSMAGFLAPFGARRSTLPFRTEASFRQIFDSGHSWAGAGGSTTTDDTSTFYRGSQSVKVVTGGAGVQSFVRKTGLTSMDLTGKAIRIVFKILDTTHLRKSSPSIRLSAAADSSFVNNYNFDFYTDNGAANAHVQSNEWTVWTLPWSAVTSASGTYSLTNGVPSSRTGITALSFNMWDDSAAPITWWLDSIEVVPDTTVTPFPTGVVSITFDDTWSSPYTYAKPKMDALGYRGTWYSIVGNVGTSQYMTLNQLKTLRDLGHEVGGHSYLSVNHNATNGFASLTADDADYDMLRQKLWLEQNGFSSDSFAYPKGHFEATTDGTYVSEIAKRYFKTSRAISGGNYETQRPAQNQRLRSITGINDGSGLGGTTVTSLTAAGGVLDRIAGSGGWSILTFHQITTTTPTDSAECSQTGFNTLMDAINTRSIAVRPVAEVVDFYGFGGEA